ncbi:hypothetical protein QVD17_13427 [Tagetes erecta]|uniref:Uncharacterized protein n=1 Tax=Tagetes erecta TaxID=13708 RepID=A0AAD8KW10_TARER|nr:hypothetical protein QVD17_13427 [Tagetes erecta]
MQWRSQNQIAEISTVTDRRHRIFVNFVTFIIFIIIIISLSPHLSLYIIIHTLLSYYRNTRSLCKPSFSDAKVGPKVTLKHRSAF